MGASVVLKVFVMIWFLLGLIDMVGHIFGRELFKPRIVWWLAFALNLEMETLLYGMIIG